MKMKTDRVHFRGESVEYTVQYTKKDNNFWIELPEFLAEYSKKVSIGGSDIKKVDQDFYNLVKEFYGATREKKKVILYQISMNHPATDVRGRREDTHFGLGYDLGIHWKIVWQVKFSQDKVQYYVENATDEDINGTSGRIHSGYYHGDTPEKCNNRVKQIDWTAEREAWFQSLTDSMLSMMDKIEQFFGSDEATFLENLSKSTENLLGQGSKDNA